MYQGWENITLTDGFNNNLEDIAFTFEQDYRHLKDGTWTVFTGLILNRFTIGIVCDKVLMFMLKIMKCNASYLPILCKNNITQGGYWTRLENRKGDLLYFSYQDFYINAKI